MSDLVLTGTVVDVLSAELEGPPGEEISHLRTVVQIDEVWKGHQVAETVSVKTLELAFAGPGGEEWRNAGERVVLFLSESRETEGIYVPANVNYSQTSYIIEGEDLIATLPDDGLAQRVAALSRTELGAAVQALS